MPDYNVITAKYTQTICGTEEMEILDNSPLAFVPAALGNRWQARNAEVIGLEVLRCAPGHDPHELLVVRLVTFAGAVLGHAFGHEVLPLEQLAVTDL